MDEVLKQLSNLTGAVAMGAIFGYVMIQKDKKHVETIGMINRQNLETIQALNTENLQNHKDKTIAFMEDKSQDRVLFRDTNQVLKDLTKTNEGVVSNLLLNTEALRDLKEVYRRGN